MYPIDLEGKKAIVFGVANHRSIAWIIAQILHESSAQLAIAYQKIELTPDDAVFNMLASRRAVRSAELLMALRFRIRT